MNKRYKLTEEQFSNLISQIQEKKLTNPCWDGYQMIGMKDKYGKKVPNCVPIDEGVGDKYAEKKFGIPDNPEFEKQYNQHMLNKEKDKKIYSDDDIIIIKNPTSFNNFDSGVRCVIDNKGNLYVANPNIEKAFHDTTLKILDRLGIIKYHNDWNITIPKTFITVQRYYKTNKIYFGESNVQLLFDDDRYQSPDKVASYHNVIPVFKSFMDKAKNVNPQFDFIPFRIDHA